MGNSIKNRNGFALILLVFVIMVGLSGVLAAYLNMVSNEIKSTSAGLRNVQAFYIAEAGLAKARWALTVGEEAVGWGDTAISPFEAGNGTYIVTTAYSDAPTNEHVTIISSGYVPDNSNPTAQRQVAEANIIISSGTPTNISLDATALASSASNGHPSEDSNDGKSNSKWMAKDKGDAWLRLDYGSSNTFAKVIVNGQKNINSATIQYSNDDIVYNDVTNMIESPNWTYIFDSVEACYLKFNMTVNSNKKATINEFESYETSGAGAILDQGEFSTTW